MRQLLQPAAAQRPRQRQVARARGSLRVRRDRTARPRGRDGLWGALPGAAAAGVVELAAAGAAVPSERPTCCLSMSLSCSAVLCCYDWYTRMQVEVCDVGIRVTACRMRMMRDMIECVYSTTFLLP